MDDSMEETGSELPSPAQNDLNAFDVSMSARYKAK